jgi:spermidine/putrescine transport system substrate-binding protein
MKNKKSLLWLIILGVMLILPGCSDGGQATLNVYNWGDYIDPEVTEEFEEEFDIKVVYEEFATNEDMYVKIASGAGKYDVAIPSDYMIKKLIDEDMLNKIDMSKISNYSGIEDRFKNLAYDPANEYSVPYMWGTVGILYDKTVVTEPVDSWDILWNEKYAKQIFMMNSQRDSIGITLKKLGYSLNTKDPAELAAAKAALVAQKPLVLSYVGDEMKDAMIGGEASLAVFWSGDAAYCMSRNENLNYVIPKEGSNIWFDAMVIPKTAQNQAAAEEFINFMCRPDIALRNAEYIEYATPLGEVKAQLPEELTGNAAFYPGVDDLQNSEVFEDLADSLVLYDRMWTEVLAE